MEENKIKENTYRKGLIIIIILLMLLVFTSIVLAQTLYGTVAGNSFTLGTVKIDLGYYVDVKNDDGSSVTKCFWSKSTDPDVLDFINKHALVNNNPDPEEGEVATDEVFKAYSDGDEERYDIITRKISVKNDSDNDEYYRLYFTKTGGRLADVINVKIIDVTEDVDSGFADYEGDLDLYKIDIEEKEQPDDNLLFSGLATSFSSNNVKSLGKINKGEQRNLLLRITYPSSELLLNHNDYEQVNYSLSFNLCAEAVQVKNNDKQEFN